MTGELFEMSYPTGQERPEKRMKSAYTCDPRLAPRVQQYLDAHCDKKVVDPGAMADYLQHKFPEYGRRKKLAFRKTVERAYENIRSQASMKGTQKKRPADEVFNRTGDESGDEDSTEFSDENPEYTAYEDTNAMNSLMRNFYKKPGSRPGSKPNSQPGSGASTPIGSRSPYRPSGSDSAPTPLFTVDRQGNKNLRDPLKTKTLTSSPKPKQKQSQISLQEPKSMGLMALTGPLDNAPGTGGSKTQEVCVIEIEQTPMEEGADEKDRTKATPKKVVVQSHNQPLVKRRRKAADIEEDKKKEPEITQSKVTFADVGGNDRMLADVCKLLVHLKHPEVYQQLGMTPPRGLLLHGPPGCGKTLLAHAIAGELELPFLKVAATEIVSGVSGVSEEKVRDTFQKAMVNAPSVLFLDEIDAITQKRENASKDMERRIVSQLLTCMDELNSNPTGHVLVIGATNRPDSLDPALRRAGRFDREISLGIPDQAARERILKVLCRELRLARELDLAVLARITPGYVGADLMALAREAAITAVNRVFTALQAERKTDKCNDSVAKPDSGPSNIATTAPSTPAQRYSTATITTATTTITVNTDHSEQMQPDTADSSTDFFNDVEMADASMPVCPSGTNLADALPQPEISILPPSTHTEPTTQDVVVTLGGQTQTEMGFEAARAGSGNHQEGGVLGAGVGEVKDMDDRDRQSAFLRSLQQTTKKYTSDEQELETVLSWLKDQPPLTEEQLDNLWLEMADFEVAVRLVQPSSKREGFATIPDVTWDDIGALRDVREELQMAILAPVRHPEQFAALGLTSPPGILLAGPPGCGKTLLAKAVANESGINFISVKGPELLNMYVGESERAVRQVFQRARNSAPCVIFFDELDALCPRRADGGEGGSSVRVVNQLLTEMDGLEERKQVFIMGATNRPDIIDPAVLRPGRLDKTLYVGLPGPEDRKDILRTLTKNGTKPRLTPDLDLSAIGSDPRCSGYTGADLAALVREAAVTALRQFMVQPHMEGKSTIVGQDHFDAAFSKIKPSVSEKERLKYESMNHHLSHS